MQPSDWLLESEKQLRLIVELWETCNVSLVHRTYFFLLFRGDPMDSIYMEVEVRRLSFLRETFSMGNLAVEDDNIPTLASRSLSCCVFVVKYYYTEQTSLPCTRNACATRVYLICRKVEQK